MEFSAHHGLTFPTSEAAGKALRLSASTKMAPSHGEGVQGAASEKTVHRGQPFAKRDSSESRQPNKSVRPKNKSVFLLSLLCFRRVGRIDWVDLALDRFGRAA